jgi:hypothetical protein
MEALMKTILLQYFLRISSTMVTDNSEQLRLQMWIQAIWREQLLNGQPQIKEKQMKNDIALSLYLNSQCSSYPFETLPGSIYQEIFFLESQCIHCHS